MSNFIFKNVAASATVISLSADNNLRFYCEQEQSHRVVFSYDGNIEIEGDETLALEYLIKSCWNLFFIKSTPLQGKGRIAIFDYLVIDLDNLIITYSKENIPDNFYRIAKVIEDQVFRKLKLKAFW